MIFIARRYRRCRYGVKPGYANLVSMDYKNAITYRTFNSGGPGGQHSNRTFNAIEASLSPSAARDLGIEPVSATGTEKSQVQSRRLAVKRLRDKIRAAIKLRDAKQRYSAGHERVRNYHGPDNRVTDASGQRWSWKETVGKGDLSVCIEGRRAAMLESP